MQNFQLLNLFYNVLSAARQWGIFLVIFLFIFSCSTPKNTAYFQDIQKDTTLKNLVSKNYDLKIQKGDLLVITVAGLSPDISLYNAPQDAQPPLNGYFVDQNGNIQFIKLGLLHVEGMTRKELKEKIQKDLIPYLNDVVVNVGFLNRHVTMLGGLGPHVLPIEGDNMTILDALAQSGDIVEKGKTNNILVIREKNDDKEFKRINLQDKSIFYSPYFYVQPNDIIYVEPRKQQELNRGTQIISYITAGISLIFLIVDRVIK